MCEWATTQSLPVRPFRRFPLISTCHAIRNCVRLGSYTERRNPPLLIKLNHSCDVLSILPNRHKLLQSSTVFIKPYQSPHERFTEATLLRQRSYSSIQVQTKKILEFVVIAFLSKSKKYGTASASVFKLHAPVSLAANISSIAKSLHILMTKDLDITVLGSPLV